MLTVQKLLISSLIFISAAAAAQTRVAADVEVKTVMDGRATTVRSQLYCTASGERIQVYNGYPAHYTFTNLQGELRTYFPVSNEVFTDRKDDYSSRDEVLYLFLSGKSDDMGLSGYGYRLVSSTTEDGLLKRSYIPLKGHGKGVSRVEIVFEDYLPIYIGYFDDKGALVSKTYLSSFARYQNVMFPGRITSIAYTAKKDSTITRSIYSNIRVDSDDPMFQFRIPADARSISSAKTRK